MHGGKLPDYIFMNYSTQTSPNQKQPQTKKSLPFMRISAIFSGCPQGDAGPAQGGGTSPWHGPRCPPAPSPRSAHGPREQRSRHEVRDTGEGLLAPRQWQALQERRASPGPPARLPRVLLTPSLPTGEGHGSDTPLQTKAPTAHLSLCSSS